MNPDNPWVKFVTSSFETTLDKKVAFLPNLGGTLPLAVILQITCFPEYGTALLVCVIHHITHLMIDGYLAVKIK